MQTIHNLIGYGLVRGLPLIRKYWFYHQGRLLQLQLSIQAFSLVSLDTGVIIMKNAAGVMMALIFVVLIAWTVTASEHCNNNEDDDDDCQTGNEHLNPAHAYEKSHQVDFLFSKETDDKLSEVKLSQTFDDVKGSLRECGCRVSNDAITPQDANHAQPDADSQEEAARQEARSLEDRRRMEARLEAWPPSKPKGAIYLKVMALPYRVNMLKGEKPCP